MRTAKQSAEDYLREYNRLVNRGLASALFGWELNPEGKDAVLTTLRAAVYVQRQVIDVVARSDTPRAAHAELSVLGKIEVAKAAGVAN